MSKLMQWRRVENSDENITGLQLWMTLDGCNWFPYTNPSFTHLRKPELNVEGASKGITTAQYCLKLGFKYLDKEGNLVE